MSKDDLDNKWLKLAYSDKQEGSSEEDADEYSLREIKNRVLVGSKGIGRFSSDSLGSVITIRTKVMYEDIEHQLTVNWDDFDKDLRTLFEEISVNYQENTLLSRTDVDSYTIIEISKLRNSWTEEQLDGVTEKLRRLKNPFIENDDLIIYCGMNIFYEYKFVKNTKLSFINNTNIKNHILFPINLDFSVPFISKFYPNIGDYARIRSNISKILKLKSITIECKIEEGKTNIVLTDRGELIYKVRKDIGRTALNDLDKVNISINYLTQSAKYNFTTRMGIAPLRYGNIFIYKNGFHVSPYGDANFDIFELNLRKTQGYNRFLGLRELIGYISIDDSKNLFREVSSRNHGFIENGYFKSLQNFYMEHIHKPLEQYVQLINWGEIKNTKKQIFLKDVSIEENIKDNFKKYITKDDFKIIDFNPELDFEKNKSEKIIERISESINNPKPDKKRLDDDTKTLGKQFKSLERETTLANKKAEKESKKNEALERQNRSLSSSRTGESYGQQITHHFRKSSWLLKDSIEDLEKLKKYIPEKEIFSFNNALRKISRTQYELSAFQELLTKTEIETRKGTLINWIDFFKWHFDQKSKMKIIVTVNSDSELTKSNWNVVKTNAIEVIMMLENFYENAVEHDATILDIMFYDHFFTVTSDSNSIPDDSLINIFELGFSTKKNDTGIGLNQISKFLSKRKMKIVAQNIVSSK